MSMKLTLSAIVLALSLPTAALAAASSEPAKKAEPSVTETAFGTLEDGGKVTLLHAHQRIRARR